MGRSDVIEPLNGVKMLPFLKSHDHKQAAGVSMKMRKPDEKSPEETSEEENDPAMAIEACARDLIKAVHSMDVKAAAEAMKDAFDILDASPHEEYDHSKDSDNSFKNQNIKAAKQQEY